MSSTELLQLLNSNAGGIVKATYRDKDNRIVNGIVHSIEGDNVTIDASTNIIPIINVIKVQII